jgi:hypothetical protein
MEKNILESKTFKIVILSVAGAIVLVFVFGMGVYAGTRRADFSFKWAAAYHRNFGGPQGGFLGDPMGGEFTAGNGAFGQIIKIEGQSLTIKGRDGVEKIIVADGDASIKFQNQNKKVSDLKIGDNVVVIGEPNSSGQIDAELIRVMPAPPASPRGNPTPVNNLPASLN